MSDECREKSSLVLMALAKRLRDRARHLETQADGAERLAALVDDDEFLWELACAHQAKIYREG